MIDTLRADTLKRTIPGLLVLSLVLWQFTGCAGLAGKSRVERFNRIAKAYEWALESGNYRGAAGYLDPAAANPPADFKPYANIKVSQYTITRAKVSEDKRSIEQDVEIEYYLLDQSIVKTTMDHQVWHFGEAKNEWMLQSGLPEFPQ